jgi:hypothetical protein
MSLRTSRFRSDIQEKQKAHDIVRPRRKTMYRNRRIPAANGTRTRRTRAGLPKLACALAGLAIACAAAPAFAAGSLSSSVALLITPNPSQFGQNAHFGVVVSESGNGSVYPTGTVTVTNETDHADICTGLALSGSTNVKSTSCDISGLPVGTRVIVATYSGDANYSAQSSNPVTQTITGIELSRSSGDAEYSQSVTFTATVAGNNPTGTVVFSDVDSLHTLCTSSLGGSGNVRTAACTNSTLSPGTYHIGAAYQGDGNNPGMVSGNVTFTVAYAVSHVFLSRLTIDRLAQGQNVALNAKVTVDLGVNAAPTGLVDFIDSSTGATLCTVSAVVDASLGPTTTTARCDTTALSAGIHSIYASYRGNVDSYLNGALSNDITQTMLVQPTLTLSSSASSPVFNQPITLTATLSGATSPTGVVEFGEVAGPDSCHAVALSASGSNYVATCQTFAQAAGPHQLFAAYQGDGSNASVEATMSETVRKADTVVSNVRAEPATIALGASTTIALALGAASPSAGGGITTGTLSVSDGSASCTPNLAAATLICTLTPTSSGVKTLTASYSGDANFNPSSGTGMLTVTGSSSATYTVTPLVGANGSISPSAPQTIAAGATASFSVAANSGYVASVSGCGGSLSGSVYTTAPIQADCFVTAVFAPSATANVTLNQFGLSGAWYNPATGGQGLFLSLLADQTGPGTGIAFAGWFTYDVAPAGGAEKQRWYSLQGPVDNVNRIATLSIYKGDGGNFDAPPRVAATPVGSATLQFADCSHGTLTYLFSDGSGRSGTIPLSRLDASITCSPTGDNGVPAPSFQLTGSWYAPATSGQGIFSVVNPSDRMLLMAWYTYKPNGLADGDASQRWYTLQFGPGTYTASTAPTNVPIFTGTGGVFDDHAPYTSTQVGTATVTFADCGTMHIDYTFTGGTNAGLSGHIDPVRLGNAPAQCGL